MILLIGAIGFILLIAGPAALVMHAAEPRTPQETPISKGVYEKEINDMFPYCFLTVAAGLTMILIATVLAIFG